MSFLGTPARLRREGALARDKNVPNIVQQMARKMVEKKETPKKDEK